MPSRKSSPSRGLDDKLNDTEKVIIESLCLQGESVDEIFPKIIQRRLEGNENLVTLPMIQEHYDQTKSHAKKLSCFLTGLEADTFCDIQLNIKGSTIRLGKIRIPIHKSIADQISSLGVEANTFCALVRDLPEELKKVQEIPALIGSRWS